MLNEAQLEETELELGTPEKFVPLLNPDARYLFSEGGRASAKSHFFAERCVEEAISIDGYRFVCLREIQKTLNQSVKLLIEDKIKDMGVGSYFIKRKEYIETKRGGIIIFQGMQNHNADSIKSLEGYFRAWFEEAQTMSQYSLDLLRPTIRSPGSQMWFSWNRKNPTDPIDLFRKANPPRAVHVHSTYLDNPYLPDEALEEAEYDRRANPEKHKHIWLGGYLANSEAKVFTHGKHWRIGDVAEVEAAAIQFRLQRRQGGDWGFAQDPTCAVVLFVDHVNKKIYVWRELWRIGLEIDHTPTFFKTIPDFERWTCIADSARPETISYCQRNGLPRIVAARKGPNSVLEGLDFLKTYEMIVHPNCTHVIDELTLYSWQVDKITQRVLPVLQDKKNHMIDSLRYSIEDDRKPRVGFHVPGKR